MSFNSRSLDDVHGSVDTEPKGKFRKFISFFGPAYLISIGYMDPGNWATDISGGSKFGYKLIWILLLSNIIAIFLQTLCTRLGVVYGKDLAQANREYFPKKINYILYVFAEIAIIATDLAEVLGMAIGLKLLFGVPIIWGITITLLDTFILLYLQKLGIRKLELFIISLVFLIASSFAIILYMAQPDLIKISQGLIPSALNQEALYISIAIIGATIMPHNLYLHSALVQTRKINRSESGIKKALKMNFLDSVVALNISFLINASILILAAVTFHSNGLTEIIGIEEAYSLLNPILGNRLAPILFGIALIAAGQSSTITGTLSGQIVMEGYLHLRLDPWIRRFLTRILATVPAYFVILFTPDHNISSLLILSQIVLSCQLGFAIIPLIHFVSDKTKMQKFAISTITKIVAWSIVILLVILNFKMVLNEMEDYFNGTNSIVFIKILIILFLLFCILILLYILCYPIFNSKNYKLEDTVVHPKLTFDIDINQSKVFDKIAIALDFSEDDSKLINYALTQKNNNTTFILIHIVESVNARIFGNQANDFETRQDIENLNQYKHELIKLGIKSEAFIGFQNRSKNIVKIIKEQKADLLIVGSHGHSGVSDVLFGETINKVRHSVKIPIFIIHLD